MYGGGPVSYTHLDVYKRQAYIKIKGKQIHLGHYDYLQDAIEAREKAEKLYMK